MNLVLDEVVSSLQKLGGKNDDRCGSISHFFILKLGKLNENFSGWMGNIELCQNCGSIISDGNISGRIDKHFIKSLWSEGALDNIGQGLDCGNYTG